jgi:S1-C subfamily serine protease
MSAVLITEKRGKFEGNEFECDTWGLSVKEITPRMVKNLRLDDDKGVLVSGIRAGSPADEAEVYRGYVIKKVDGQNVTDLEQFKTIYENMKELPAKGRMLEVTFKDALIYALLHEE